MDEQKTLLARIRAAWIDMLRQNRGAEGLPQRYYDLKIEDIRGHGEEFDIHLTFRAGFSYCCCETFCHTGVFTEKRWQKLRSALATHGVEPNKPLIVHIYARLEAGARLHHGRSVEPKPQVYDRGPWLNTAHEQQLP